MHTGIFMKVDGATGESKNSAYSTWTECDSVSWSATQRALISGGGLASGKADFGDLTVAAKVDKVFPALMIKCATGEHVSKIEIAFAKMGGDQVEYFKSTLEDVIVTGCHLSGTTSDQPSATYTFQAAKIKKEYSEQTDKGSKGATSTFSFDVKQNKKA